MPQQTAEHVRSRQPRIMPRRLLALGVALIVLVQALALTDAAFSSSPAASAAATKTCVVKKRNKQGRLVTVYVKKNGKKVPKRTAAACKTTKKKPKLCVVKKRNKNGKLVVVYQTRLARIKVRQHGKLVTVRRRVFVYKYVTKTVHGKKQRVKVKVPKLGPCGKKQSTSAGIPVTIDVVDPSAAHLDFGGFQRDVPLSGSVKGFIVGKGFVLGQDNQIQLTGAHITLAPTGIFIDDVCNGEVSDAIRTDQSSYIELDEGSTGNQVNVAPNASITGLIHLRVQTSLDMRNDDTGCNQPYFTTGWTDFTVPLFLRGKLTAGNQGLTSTISTGETVLDQLSACLTPGDPTLPCNGFAIPFPAILTSTIVGVVHIGQK